MELIRKCWGKPIQVWLLKRHLAYSGKFRIFSYLPSQTVRHGVQQWYNTGQALFQTRYMGLLVACRLTNGNAAIMRYMVLPELSCHYCILDFSFLLNVWILKCLSWKSFNKCLRGYRFYIVKVDTDVKRQVLAVL